MVLFYATNIFLEVSAGVAWWLTTKTASGLYNGVSYLIYGNTELTMNKKEIMVIDFEDEDNKEQMNQLLNEIKSLRNEIIDLKE